MTFGRVARATGAVAGLSLSTIGASALRAQSAPHRAILVSFDGFSEQRFREYADSVTAPRLWAMFRGGLCAESVRPAFPSVTPTGHASIWTGAYSNVNGVAAIASGRLPLELTSILETTDGYKASSLRAEPIWISTARQGKMVFSHMATQSPQPPLYMPVVRPTPDLDSSRASAASAIVRENIAALNAYNELVAPSRIIQSPAELSWAFGADGDSLHAQILDDSTVSVRLNSDATHAVRVQLAATDTTAPRGRPLARYFSAPLAVELARGRRTFVYFRLFELPRDRSSLLLYVSEARVVQANRQSVAESYDGAVQGLPGNGANKLLESGALGPRVPNGGNGIAEFRYLETAELVTRQFMRGTEWGWKTYHPDLTTDYLPYPDEALHTFIGYADPSTPGVSASARANAARMLRRAYSLVDLRLEQLERLAGNDPNTRLFVTGEHGMRPAWLAFNPNAVLREAGFVTLDSAGAIVLRRTRAAATPGGWISINRATRRGGGVPSDSVAPILARVEAALLAARDSAGTQIVTRVFRARSAEADSLGIGGPSGGDLYFALAPGYYWTAAPGAPLVAPLAFPAGEHGYPSIEHDMHPALCILGGSTPKRIGEVRSIDIAPSVAAWLGISPPADSRGASLLRR